MSRQLALLWGGVSLTLLLLSPWAFVLDSGLWDCVFKSVTGFACPTCGTTRAAITLSRLELGRALTHYPLPAIGWLAFLSGGLIASALSLSGRTPPAIPDRLPGWARAVIVAAVAGNWMYSIATGV